MHVGIIHCVHILIKSSLILYADSLQSYRDSYMSCLLPVVDYLYYFQASCNDFWDGQGGQEEAEGGRL